MSGLEYSLWELEIVNTFLTYIPSRAIRALQRLKILNLSGMNSIILIIRFDNSRLVVLLFELHLSQYFTVPFTFHLYSITFLYLHEQCFSNWMFLAMCIINNFMNVLHITLICFIEIAHILLLKVLHCIVITTKENHCFRCNIIDSSEILLLKHYFYFSAYFRSHVSELH